jgi:hypothetical protein
MGRIYATRIPERLEGLSPQNILTLYPLMKLDIQVHEKECPAQKKEDGPVGAVPGPWLGRATMGDQTDNIRPFRTLQLVADEGRKVMAKRKASHGRESAPAGVADLKVGSKVTVKGTIHLENTEEVYIADEIEITNYKS